MYCRILLLYNLIMNEHEGEDSTSSNQQEQMETSDAAKEKSKLRNTLGKVIKTIVKNKNENYKNIEMENLESGLYILSIFLGTKKPVTFKLIKSI